MTDRSPDPTDRAQVVRGLRDVADFIEVTSDLPVPRFCELMLNVVGPDEASERAEIDRIAAILGTRPREYDGRSHYVVARRWGPVTYRALAITEEAMQRYRQGDDNG